MHQFLKFIYRIKFYMFRTIPLYIIRNFHCTHSNDICHKICEQEQGGVPSCTCSQPVSKPVWHILFLCVQWRTPDDGQMNCPKHVEFYSINKFEKLVHLVGFTIRIYHDARSSERQITEGTFVTVVSSSDITLIQNFGNLEWSPVSRKDTRRAFLPHNPNCFWRS